MSIQGQESHYQPCHKTYRFVIWSKELTFSVPLLFPHLQIRNNNSTYILWIVSQGNREGVYHEGDLLSSAVGINTCNSGEGTEIDRERSQVMQTQRQIWTTSWGALEPVWSFRSVQSWAKMTSTFYAGMNQSLDVSDLGRGMTMDEAAVCNWGNSC